MEVKKTLESRNNSYRFTIEEDDQIVGSGYLAFIYNDQRENPYGVMEYVYVKDGYQGKGYGSQIVKAIIAEAKEQECYKLLSQCRYGKEKVHELYKKLGFREHGKNFRMDLLEMPPQEAVIAYGAK